MKIYLLLFFLIFTSTNAFSASSKRQKVLLLISVDFEEEAKRLPWIVGWRRDYVREMSQKLIDTFVNEFENDPVLSGMLDVEYRDLADQNALWQALRSPDYAAIFWLSHGGISSNPLQSKGSTSIYDYQLFEVNQVFAQVHPNVKFLGFINCLSSNAVSELAETNNWKDNNPDLKTYSFDKKVDALSGLKESIAQSKWRLRRPFAKRSSKRVVRGVSVHLTRECAGSEDGTYNAVRVEDARGRVVTTFAPCEEGDRQYSLGIIALEKYKHPSDLKLVVTTGTRPLNMAPISIGLGRFKISLRGTYPQQDSDDYKVFAKRNGEPIGSTRNVYRYRPTSSRPVVIFDQNDFEK